MDHFEETWSTHDRLRLHAQGWLPPKPRAAVGLIHGIGEHGARYAHLAAALTEAGLALVTFDLRGHGRSEGPRGHAPSYAAVMRDLALFETRTGERFPDLPFFLYGHSLGGNLVVNYLLRQPHRVRAAVVSAPAFRPGRPLPAWKRLILPVAAHVWPRLSLATALKRDALSRTPREVTEYNRDPLVHGRVSARFGQEFLAAGLWALAHAAELRTPLLLMQGSEDCITSVPATREFAARAGSSATLRIWNGLYHELHHEPEQQEVFRFVIDWLTRFL